MGSTSCALTSTSRRATGRSTSAEQMRMLLQRRSSGSEWIAKDLRERHNVEVFRRPPSSGTTTSGDRRARLRRRVRAKSRTGLRHRCRGRRTLAVGRTVFSHRTGMPRRCREVMEATSTCSTSACARRRSCTSPSPTTTWAAASVGSHNAAAYGSFSLRRHAGAVRRGDPGPAPPHRGQTWQEERAGACRTTSCRSTERSRPSRRSPPSRWWSTPAMARWPGGAGAPRTPRRTSRRYSATRTATSRTIPIRRSWRTCGR